MGSTATEARRRRTGADRDKLVATITKQYQGTTRTPGRSIRDIAREHNVSYGFTHRVLSLAGVELRGRGGATRKKASAK